MARALYRDADIYLLDDPLSAVDVKVSKHLFQKYHNQDFLSRVHSLLFSFVSSAIKGYLRLKIVILVTHQIQFLQEATKILVLDHVARQTKIELDPRIAFVMLQGEMVQMGGYAELMASSSSFAHLLEDIHQHEEETRTNMHKQLSIISSKQGENDLQDEGATLLTHADTKQEGAVRWHVYASYIRAGLGCIASFIFVILLFTLHQAISMFSNWWLATWSEDESHRHSGLTNCTSATMEPVDAVRSMSSSEWTVHRNRRFYLYCGKSLCAEYR